MSKGILVRSSIPKTKVMVLAARPRLLILWGFLRSFHVPALISPNYYRLGTQGFSLAWSMITSATPQKMRRAEVEDEGRWTI